MVLCIDIAIGGSRLTKTATITAPAAFAATAPIAQTTRTRAAAREACYPVPSRPGPVTYP